LGRRATGWLLGLVLALALAAPALGAKPSPVEKLAADAAAAYRAGDYGKAAEQLERAYQAQPVGTILYNLAKAYEKQGDNEKALDRYQRYLAGDDTDPKYKARAEARVAALKDALLPKPPPEKHEAPPPPAIVQAPPPTPAPPVDENWLRQKRARRRDSAIGFTLLGTTAVVLTVAFALDGYAVQGRGQFGQTLVEDDKRALRDSSMTEWIAGNVLLGVGAVTAVLSIWLIVRSSRPLPPRRAQLLPAISPRGAALALEVRF